MARANPLPVKPRSKVEPKPTISPKMVAPGFRVGEIFHRKDAAPFADNQAFAIAIERLGACFGSALFLGKLAEHLLAGLTKRVHLAVRPADQEEIGFDCDAGCGPPRRPPTGRPRRFR